MTVKTTHLLERLFAQAHTDLSELCNLFAYWKSLGAAGEDEVYEFGKDVPYTTPEVNGTRNILRHVHLVPIVDLSQKAKWDQNWMRYSRRTSNRALVYVDNERGDFLLLDIIPEPNAHKVARMLTAQDKAIMNFYADIAEQFIYFNQIIA